MNCRDSESLILAERDGVLPSEKRAALSDHVAACPACAQLRTSLANALAAYQAGLATVAVPDADEAWRDLRAKLRGTDKSSRKRPLAPVIWFSASLAAAAAIAFAVFVSRPATPAASPGLAGTPPPPPLHDPSAIAGADFVEPGDPNASTLVYVDKESGWLVVWATASEANTAG